MYFHFALPFNPSNLAVARKKKTHAFGRLPIENKKIAITTVPYIDCVVRLTYSTPLSSNAGSSIDDVRITYFHRMSPPSQPNLLPQDTHEEQEEIPNRKPRKDEIDDVVHHLDREHTLAAKAMAGIEDLSEVREGVNGSEERSIEPATALEDEFVQRVWNVRFSHRVANVF